MNFRKKRNICFRPNHKYCLFHLHLPHRISLSALILLKTTTVRALIESPKEFWLMVWSTGLIRWQSFSNWFTILNKYLNSGQFPKSHPFIKEVPNKILKTTGQLQTFAQLPRSLRDLFLIVILNGKIPLEWLDLTINSFKTKCKTAILRLWSSPCYIINIIHPLLNPKPLPPYWLQ